jgi:superfamily II DNA or RNA helicase
MMMNSTLNPQSQPSSPTELRAYQKRAVEMASSKSCIVVLPTGAGKTLIAASIAKKFEKTLFLVPTRLLVSQQAKAIFKETGLQVREFMSGNPIPTNYSVIVSTPSAFISLANTNSHFSFAHFGLIIFDEVHHVMKRHPYRTIARQLNSLGHRPQILGLTASLTYSLGALQISNAITDICSDLNLSGRCVFSCSESDLVAEGYHASIPAESEQNLEVILS